MSQPEWVSSLSVGMEYKIDSRGLHFKQQYAYNTHDTTHIYVELYIGNIFATKKIANIDATYNISEH